jgi:putative colanic acid biosynthesis acetyltransferase WcaF
LFRPFATRLFKKWRVFVLKCFGAKIEWSSHIYASVKIWAPWNLEMGAYSSLGPNVDCYNQGKITIGRNTVISQKTYLCASSHDYTKANFPLVLKPITIGDGVWIAAAAFIGPNAIIGNHAIIAARGVVVKDVEKNTIVGGNPAIFIKNRLVK